MRARVAHDAGRHEGHAGELHGEQLELHCLWAHCTEVARLRASELASG